jgi:hypothetical protein
MLSRLEDTPIGDFAKTINVFMFSTFPFSLPFGFPTIWMTRTRDFSFQPQG